MCTVLAAAISPFGIRTMSIILTTVILSMLRAGTLMNTWLKSARQILIGAIQSIALPDIRRRIGMAQAAAIRRFRMGITLITWSTDASTILTAITATTTVRWR